MGFFESLPGALNNSLVDLGMGLLAAGGPSAKQVGLGQALAAGLQNMRQGDEERLMQQFKLMQLRQLQTKMEDEQKVRDFYGNLGNYIQTPQSQALAGGGGPTVENAAKIPTMPGGFNAGAMYRAMLQSGSPTLAQAGLSGLTKEEEAFTLKPGETRFKGAKAVASMAPEQEVKEGYLVRGPNGQWAIDPALFQAHLQAKATGATRVNNNINNNTEKTFLSSVAEKVGNSIASASDQAKAAVGTLNTLDRLDAALSSGKVMAGPMTSPRVVLMQIGNQLGMTGKDANETLLNTRNAIQSMAQLELDAAQQMKGQGQITEAEREILRRAASGSIDGLTVPEVKALSGALRKVASFKINSNRQNMERLRRNPNSASMVDFLDIPAADSKPMAGGVKFLGFE